MKKPAVKPIAMQATLSTFIGRIEEENKGVLGLTLTPACPGRVVAVSDAQLSDTTRNCCSTQRCCNSMQDEPYGKTLGRQRNKHHLRYYQRRNL